jgi:uncharacterized protein YndB with AHSA1/START domain
MNNTISIESLPENKQIIITHSYHNTLEELWKAHTEPELLEKWWAPLPYKAIVLSNDFSKGGKLHYYMLSPEGQKHYCIVEYLEIESLKSYELLDAFCDENAIINEEFPRMKWFNQFNEINGVTTITNTINFEHIHDMNRILEMGFEQGYKMGLNQLYDLLNQKQK